MIPYQCKAKASVQPEQRSRWLRAFALGICCLLLLFLTVEVAHSHDAGAPDAAHCQLCVAAHVALGPASVSAALELAIFWAGQAAGRAVEAFPVFRPVSPIRPPPEAWAGMDGVRSRYNLL